MGIESPANLLFRERNDAKGRLRERSVGTTARVPAGRWGAIEARGASVMARESRGVRGVHGIRQRTRFEAIFNKHTWPSTDPGVAPRHPVGAEKKRDKLHTCWIVRGRMRRRRSVKVEPACARRRPGARRRRRHGRCGRCWCRARARVGEHCGFCAIDRELSGRLGQGLTSCSPRGSKPSAKGATAP